MDKYFALTNRMIKILADYSPTLEAFSIDECFIDVTETQKFFGGGMYQMALEIKSRVREELGEWMKCSIGVSFTKLLAKLASEMNKPDGLTFLTPDNYLDETKCVAVSEVCGIGYSRTKYLNSRGAYTLGQARKLDLPREIWELVWLRSNDELTTIDDLEPAKSVSRTYTTFQATSHKSQVTKLIRNLVEEAAAKLREMGMAGRTFCLSLDSFWARKTVEAPTSDPLVIFDLLNREYEKNPIVNIRQAGVWISNLMFNTQCLMFNNRRQLLDATDKVNQKFGLFTLYPATLLGTELVRPEVTGYLGDKYYRFAGDR